MSNDDQHSIDELIQEAKSGKPECRERLFETCRGYLRLLARAQVHRGLQSKIDASDVVQLTMLEAHQDFSSFQGTTKAQWLAWLRRILSRNTTDMVRRYQGAAMRDTRKEVAIRHASDGSGVGGVAEPAAPVATPSQEVLRRDEELQLVDALEQLSEDHAEVVLLRNIQRLPFDEVAQLMGRSRPAVQMLWMRAIKKLQTIMTE